jgi:hypothetical protein
VMGSQSPNVEQTPHFPVWVRTAAEISQESEMKVWSVLAGRRSQPFSKNRGAAGCRSVSCSCAGTVASSSPHIGREVGEGQVSWLY